MKCDADMFLTSGIYLKSVIMQIIDYFIEMAKRKWFSIDPE